MCQCCEEGDPSSALEKLMSRVKEGELSEGVLLRLLWTVQQKAPTSFPPPLCSLLEGMEDDTPESYGKQTEGMEDPFRDENTERVTSVCISLRCCPDVIIFLFFFCSNRVFNLFSNFYS